MKKLLLISIIALSGCTNAVLSPDRTKPVPNQAHSPEDSYYNLTQKSVRYIKKAQMVQYNCDVQSLRHNEQRLIMEVAPPVIIQDGRAVVMQGYPTTKVYNQAIAPFNMTQCIVEGTKTGTERIISQFVGTVEKLALKTLDQSKWYAIYKLVKGSKSNVTAGGDVVISEDGGTSTYSPDNSDNSVTNPEPVEEVSEEVVEDTEAVSE